jgi:uncharacterized protein (TIRG00374 family)
MIAAARRLAGRAGRSRRARVACQAVVSLALIALIVGKVPADKLRAAWDAVSLPTLLLVAGCYALTMLSNVRRWQILLRSQGVEEDAVRLLEVFWVGLFCSLFLPSAAGGDAYRVYEVARRRRPALWSVLVATFQDRLAGLGVLTCVGFVGACWYRDRLSPHLALAAQAVCGLGLLAAITLFHQAYVLRLGARLLARLPLPDAAVRLLEGKTAGRLAAWLGPLREAPPLNLWRAARVTGLALATFLAAVAMYAVVANALDASCSWLALCLIVALAGVARMLPISLGGVGVGEEAFIFLAGLFGMAESQATAVALVVLAVSTLISLLGGALLLGRWARGPQAPAQAPTATEATPDLLPLPALDDTRPGVRRDAA